MEQPQPIMPTPQPQKPNNSKGIIGLILALAGFIAFGLPLGIAAIIFGIIEEPKSKYAWAAIIIGVLDVVIVGFYLSIL